MAIAKLRHRVHLCSQKDVVQDGEWKLAREGVLSMWAAIDEKSASRFSERGAAMGESRNRRTHVIMTRYHPDLDISALAWIYEERRKSAPRWFKILRVGQTEGVGTQFFKFDCRIVERGEQAAPPAADEPSQGPAVWMPKGVQL